MELSGAVTVDTGRGDSMTIESLSAADPAVLSENASTAPTRKSGWGWRHYLCLVGAGFLVWGAWTLISWLSDDPGPITHYRDTSSSSYTIGIVYQAAAVLVAIGLLTYVVRGCLRQRRLTFDAQLCIGGALAYWIDPFYNFFVPSNAFSSNLVNVGNWCSHAPLVVNKNCGATPEPILMTGVIYLVGFLGFAMLGGKLMDFLGRRFPRMSTAQRLLICALAAMAFDIPIDGFATLNNLWNMFAPTSISLFGAKHEFPLWIPLAAVVFFGGPMAVRHFRDDRGRTVFERGLDHLSPRRQTLVSLFSVVSFMQIQVFVVVMAIAPMGFYADHTPAYPRFVINELCNDGGIHSSPYGACPGTTTRFSAPIRFLPGAPVAPHHSS
jgi:hypothetical protein